MPNGNVGNRGQRGGQSCPGKGGGKGSGGGSAPLDSDWVCHICNYTDNRDWRKKCRRCEAYRNDELGRKLGLGRPAPTLAERQVQLQRTASQQQNQQKKKEEAERKRLKEENERLKELVAAKSAQQPAAGEGDGEDGGDDMEDGSPYASWTEEERSKRLELAKGALAYALECHGESSDQAIKHREEIAALQRASREAKPFKAHRAQLERRRDRLRMQQERDEEAISTAQAEIQQLQEKVAGLQTAVADRAKAITDVSEELREIVRKALAEESEGEAPKPPWTQSTTPWGAMAAAIAGLATQPGIPAEFAALLVHVQQVGETLAAQQATQPPRPSEPPSTAASSGTGAGAGSTAPGQGKAGLAAPATPVALAPHAKPTNAPPKDDPRPLTTSPPPPPPGDSRDDGDKTHSGGGKIDAAAATAAATAAAAAINNGETEEADPELVEDGSGDSTAMEVDIEASLAMLPEANRRRLRAAIRFGGARVNEGPEDDAGASRRGERERSPRPNRNAEGGDL